MKPSAAAINELRGMAGPAGDRHAVSGSGLATRVSRLAVRGFAGDQQFAQHVKIPAQDAQTDIAFKSSLRPVAAAFQAVAGLQRANRRFDSRVRLPCLAELDAGRLLLLGGLMGSGHRQARMLDDRGQLFLVFGAVKAPIGGRT